MCNVAVMSSCLHGSPEFAKPVFSICKISKMTNENTADSNLSVVLVKPGAPVTDAISFEYRLIPTPAHGGGARFDSFSDEICILTTFFLKR